jgi:hypothetical protein
MRGYKVGLTPVNENPFADIVPLPQRCGVEGVYEFRCCIPSLTRPFRIPSSNFLRLSVAGLKFHRYTPQKVCLVVVRNRH